MKRLAPPLGFLLRLAVSLALLGAIVWIVDGAGLWRRLASADFRWFALAVACGLVANVVAAWRWVAIARGLALTTRTGVLLVAYGRGVALNAVLPGAMLGGDAYRTLALERLGNPLLKSAASVALDRLSGLWVLFVLSGCAWLALAGNDDAIGAAAPLHLGGIGLAAAAPFAARWLNDRLGLPPETWAARFLRLLAETARFARLTLLPSLAIQLATVAALWASLQAVAAEASPLYLAAVAAPVFFVAALPLSVGGYGTREAALAGYWLLAGLPVEAAVAGALLNGLAATLQGALWAPLFLFGTRR